MKAPVAHLACKAEFLETENLAVKTRNEEDTHEPKRDSKPGVGTSEQKDSCTLSPGLNAEAVQMGGNTGENKTGTFSRHRGATAERTKDTFLTSDQEKAQDTGRELGLGHWRALGFSGLTTCSAGLGHR